MVLQIGELVDYSVTIVAFLTFWWFHHDPVPERSVPANTILEIRGRSKWNANKFDYFEKYGSDIFLKCRYNCTWFNEGFPNNCTRFNEIFPKFFTLKLSSWKPPLWTLRLENIEHPGLQELEIDQDWHWIRNARPRTGLCSHCQIELLIPQMHRDSRDLVLGSWIISPMCGLSLSSN